MYRSETVWTECSVHGEGKFSNVSWGESEKVASDPVYYTHLTLPTNREV